MKKMVTNPTELNICGVLKYLFSRMPGQLVRSLMGFALFRNPEFRSELFQNAGYCHLKLLKKACRFAV